jgi:hypothetical protein
MRKEASDIRRNIIGRMIDMSKLIRGTKEEIQDIDRKM